MNPYQNTIDKLLADYVALQNATLLQSVGFVVATILAVLTAFIAIGNTKKLGVKLLLWVFYALQLVAIILVFTSQIEPVGAVTTIDLLMWAGSLAISVLLFALSITWRLLQRYRME